MVVKAAAARALCIVTVEAYTKSRDLARTIESKGGWF
jgi:hypothetical protein